MTALDAGVLARFLSLAGDRLSGDWVVIGGTVLPLLGVDHRVTVDIDLAGPEGTDQTVALYQIAEELGLPVEAVNQAAAFFLDRIPDWREHLVSIHRGRRARIHVPDPTLFVLLKVGRLTEADLSDCQAMLELARKRAMPVDSTRVVEAVRTALRGEASPGRAGRLTTLLESLGPGSDPR